MYKLLVHNKIISPESNTVTNNRIVISIGIFLLLLTGCGTATPQKSPSATMIEQTATQSAYPYPVSQPSPVNMNYTYPGPLGENGTSTPVPTMTYFVNHLPVQTPSSGKANVTGQLLINGKGGKPYLATLYLASTIAPSDPKYPPLISFSEKTDPLASQEVDTGRFLFTDVEPGQHAIIVWTVYG